MSINHVMSCLLLQWGGLTPALQAAGRLPQPAHAPRLRRCWIFASFSWITESRRSWRRGSEPRRRRSQVTQVRVIYLPIYYGCRSYLCVCLLLRVTNKQGCNKQTNLKESFLKHLFVYAALFVSFAYLFMLSYLNVLFTVRHFVYINRNIRESRCKPSTRPLFNISWCVCTTVFLGLQKHLGRKRLLR